MHGPPGNREDCMSQNTFIFNIYNHIKIILRNKEHLFLESTYGSSSTFSTSFPHESECLVVKKQIESWDKVTLLKYTL